MLEVMIATCGPDGIKRVEEMQLPRVEGVCYTVSWQRNDGCNIPSSLTARDDIKVLREPSVGLSKNRNRLLREATGDILLVADDDLRYTPERLMSVVKTFDEHPEIDMAMFKFEGTGKWYPDYEFDLLKWHRNVFVNSFEMAFRRDSEAAKLRFDTRFGIAANYLKAGEDEKFMHDARRRGIPGRFFPITICEHPHPSTGERPVTDNGVLASFGACIYIMYPLTWPLRIPLKAWRLRRARFAPFIHSLRYMLRGIVYIITHPKQPEK